MHALITLAVNAARRSHQKENASGHATGRVAVNVPRLNSSLHHWKPNRCVIVLTAADTKEVRTDHLPKAVYKYTYVHTYVYVHTYLITLINPFKL